jgi:glutamate synthase (NADPH/NADH) small chain
VTQFELMPMPPEEENKALTWPYWPYKLRTSSSHDEGCSRDFAVATKGFVDDGKGNVKALKAVRVDWKDGKMSEVAGSEFELPATPCSWPWASPTRWAACSKLSASKRMRGNAKATTDGEGCYATNVAKVFARRVTSVAVSRWWSWAIREGRQCARRSGCGALPDGWGRSTRFIVTSGI